MAPQFNLLAGRFTVLDPDWAFASKIVQDGRSFITLTVRRGNPPYYERRRVKGVELVVFN